MPAVNFFPLRLQKGRLQTYIEMDWEKQRTTQLFEQIKLQKQESKESRDFNQCRQHNFMSNVYLICKLSEVVTKQIIQGGKQGMIIVQLVTILKLLDKLENAGFKSELDEACIISAQI